MLDVIELNINPKSFITSVDMGEGSYQEATKPAMIFNGELFDNNEDFKVIKHLFLDYFHGIQIQICKRN
eukprot:UN10191